MTDLEAEAILVTLYSETGKIVPEVKKKTWAELLQRVPFELGMMAAKRMIRMTKIYGEPQFADYRQHVRYLHREAKRAAKPRRGLDAAQLASMSAAERDTYLEQQRKPEISPSQAAAILDALALPPKGVAGRKSSGAIEAERHRQRKMLADLRTTKQRDDGQVS